MCFFSARLLRGLWTCEGQRAKQPLRSPALESSDIENRIFRQVLQKFPLLAASPLWNLVFEFADGRSGQIRMNVMGVSRPVLSVSVLNDIGHTVAFEPGKAWTSKKGKILKLERETASMIRPHMAQDVLVDEHLPFPDVVKVVDMRSSEAQTPAVKVAVGKEK